MLQESTERARVVVDRKHCQKFREILGDAKLFDKKRKVLYSNGKVELPILRFPESELQTKLESVGAGTFDLIASVGDDIQNKSETLSLKEKLMVAVTEKVKFSVNSRLAGEIPDSWEYYGDLLLLPGTSFIDPVWEDSITEILEEICQLFRVRRVARKCPVVNDDFRSPRTDLLLGSDTWVSRKENGITYHFDITKSMFCAGNISEKLRVSRFDCRGETVVDLFAGIGYFTLPYLLHAKAQHVVACEWNPASVLALKYNLHHLGLTDRQV